MDRFFALRNGDSWFLAPEDEHHLLSVLRHQKGDEIELANEGEVYLAKIENTRPLEFLIEGKIEKSAELPKKLALCFSLLKGGHDELVLQKGTELGVHEFYPFFSSRTIVRLKDEERKKRAERFRKIVLAAASQSHREIIPEVHEIIPFGEILGLSGDSRLLAYEGKSGGASSFSEEIEDLKDGEKALMVIGPEGGFADDEVAEARKRGWKIISLGKRILRAETASLYAAGAFALLTEK